MLGLISKLTGYAPALIALALAVLVHFLLAMTVGITSAGITFLYVMALLIAAWCGYGPGLLVLTLGLFVIPYGYRNNFSPRNTDPVAVVALVTVSLLTSRMAATRRSTETRLRLTNEELDARVRKQTADLQKQLAELETLYAKLPVGLGFLDADLRYIRMNETLAGINGVPAAQHIGSPLRDTVPARIADVLEPLYRRVLETGEANLNVEVHGPAAGPAVPGDRVWLVSCSRVETEGGSVLGVQVIIQDITARKLAEDALNRANEELAQFAYVAAHDLQEPLRTVVSFSQLVKQRHGGALDADAALYLDYVVGAAKRMRELIAALLQYSRATVESGDYACPVSFDEILASALEALKSRIAETGAQVHYDSLPVVEADAERMTQVFVNLVGNALKYTREGVAPVVRVEAVHRGSEWQFSVRDNGQGFRQEYAERVFGIFKRLHGQDVPGSGIGLAICKAIVQRHGGRIWAESEEGRGSTFYFTLRTREALAKESGNC